MVGIEAAHLRWFNHGGPNDADNGGLYVARTAAGRAVFDLLGRELTPRPATVLPAAEHVAGQDCEVFKGEPLTLAS